MPRKPAEEKISKDAIAEYLTAELEGLHQRAIHYDQTLAGKINFYLVIVTALAGGLVLASESDNLVVMVVPAACLLLAFLLIVGISTLRQCLDLAATVTTIYRRVGRIRKWFVEQEPKVEAYLPFTVGDDRPQFNPNYALLRGMETILLLVNAALGGTLAGMLYVSVKFYLIGQMLSEMQRDDFILMLIIGIVTALVIWFSQISYSNRFMKRWEQRQLDTGMIHFPSDPAHPNG